MAKSPSRARALLDKTLVWDAHAGFAFEQASDLAELERWRTSGIDFVSLNIGYDVQPWDTAVRGASGYRHWIRQHPDKLLQVETIGDVERARAEGKIAVAFDIEGANSLNGDPGMVDAYYRLGVRQLLFAYNRDNLAAGGCHDGDTGLTPFGRAVLKEMNRVGMIVDATHCSHRTTMDLMEHSETPPVFSHSNVRSLWDHERNIRDDQIRRCAERGGLVCATGVGAFLGPKGAVAGHVVEHLDHLCQMIGARHVGLGLDSILKRDQGLMGLGASGSALEEFYWPKRQYSGEISGFVPPEDLEAIVEGLIARGYEEPDLAGILGANYFRLASQVWKPVRPT